MLILTRKLHEAITIGDHVTIKVLKIQGNQVSLGIDAPREIDVFREEIYHKVQKERAMNK